MPKRPNPTKDRCPPKDSSEQPIASKAALPSEPVMRRWPHPIQSPPSAPQPDPMLHYIRCALSYQNELLSEIKSLLEELTASRENS